MSAHTIDLPGHGKSTESIGGLHRDADAVKRRLDEIGGPTLLVGHSYGGMVISDAGSHDSVRGLVYVCAFMPAEGKSLMDEGPNRPAGEDDETESRRSGGYITLTDTPALRFVAERAGDILYNDCDDATTAWASERLDEQSIESFNEVPRVLSYQALPSTYVVCSLDETIPPSNQRRMATRATKTVELEASHSPFLSVPDRLADLISEEAASLGGRESRAPGTA